MDAEGRMIPIVEDDQGEGFKDEVPPDLFEKYQKQAEEENKKAALLSQAPHLPTEQAKIERYALQVNDTLPKNVPVFLLYSVDPAHKIIHFFGRKYSVHPRKNGKLMLKPTH